MEASIFIVWYLKGKVRSPQIQVAGIKYHLDHNPGRKREEPEATLQGPYQRTSINNLTKTTRFEE